MPEATRGILKISPRPSDTDKTPLHVPVMILDEKTEYGRKRLKVRPVGGRGERWVNADRVDVGPTK